MYKRNITNLSIGTRSKLDVLLSDAFLLLFQHQYFGEISNTEMNRDWECWNYQINLSQLLFQAIQNDNLSETFLELSPPYPQYLMLKKGLNKYRIIVQQFPDSQKLKDNIETISINMERWRWLPKLKKPLYILVNIPAYQLMLYQKDSTVITMKTIVGESDHATPTFNCEITYVVLHPRWNIPNSIVKNEILPAIKEEKGYLLKNNMVVKHSWRISDTNVVVIDSSFWNTIFQSKFPYKLVQLPGPTNPLGDIKFMFPNQFNVYLHDTPNRYLFERDVRMFSHGCIRIEKPLELGALLLQNDSILQLSDADRFFAPNEKRRLSKPIPISINYWTAWADEEGNIQFYPDIYLKDNLLKEEIRKTSFCN
jgi:murein L,D-transpeptidase YcbB/YkuD